MYPWDRDADSNKEELVLKSLNTFKSSLDNDYEMNGLLLLSYPCVESYELSNFSSSIDAKKQMKAIIPKLTDINENTLLLAVENMHRTMKEYGIRDYDPSNFQKENIKIFRTEAKEYTTNKYFNALSLISIMLIDLGIITEI